MVLRFNILLCGRSSVARESFTRPKFWTAFPEISRDSKAPITACAGAIGVRPGDMILAVNRQPLSTVAELTAALRQTAGTIALDLFRGGERRFLVVR